MAGQDLPEFALIMRGYDRQQVDDYVSMLRGYVEELTRRLDEKGRGHGPTRPAEPPTDVVVDPVSVLGDRITAILRAAQDAADGMHQDAQREAEQMLARARTGSRDANALTAAARAQADQITAAARTEAEALLERARSHAEHQATALLEEAQLEAARTREQAHAQAKQALEALREHLTVPDGTSAPLP